MGVVGLLLWAASGAGCQPQEIYLFDERPGPSLVDAGRGNGGSAGASEPAPPRTPPACESAACEACRVNATPCPAESNLFCHPISGECALGCDPEAPDQGAACPLDQVCHPVAGLCVECVTSASCTAPLGACDTERNRCVECTAAGDTCPAARSVCDTEAQRCVECVTVANCTADDDARFCFESRCVECRTNADCTLEPDRPICSDEFECEDED